MIGTANFLVSDIEKKLKQTKQRFLEHANKPDGWLAYKLEKKQTENDKTTSKRRIRLIWTAKGFKDFFF